MATTAIAPTSSLLDEKMKKSPTHKAGIVLFGIMVAGGILYIATRLTKDLSAVHGAGVFPYVLLGLALLIALGFEFVNGFHDTANAVATVIYTHSLDPNLAVLYSGIMNFIGVLLSSGTVAFTIITLLPVELILKVSKGSGFSMVFALLVAAILWNLATWWRGLPASSSHTMIGSIIGVGIANQLMQGSNGTSGVDWEQVTKVFKALLISPIVGFVGAALVFFLFKLVARDPRLYKAPEGTAPPPFYIRCLLILTCTGVSYAHGSNDGQKGMGLIMLILVGTVPTAYALNHTVNASEVQTFAAVSTATAGALHRRYPAKAAIGCRLVHVAAGAAASAVEQRQLPAEALQHHLRRLARVAVAIGVLARLQRAFDVHLRALLAVLFGNATEIFIEDHDVVPFGAILALARGLIAPGFCGGDREADDRIAGTGAPHLGVAPEITDQDDLVDATRHATLPHSLHLHRTSWRHPSQRG